MRTIGDRLKEQRQRAGLTQSQAAELEGLSRQYIWKLEEGENEPPAWPLIEQGAAIRNERNARRMTRNGLFRTLRRMAQRARVDGVSPHSLRRTFAVFHLRNGVDLYTLARLMGHEDIATLKVYLDLADADAAEAHRRYTLIDEL